MRSFRTLPPYFDRYNKVSYKLARGGWGALNDADFEVIREKNLELQKYDRLRGEVHRIERFRNQKHRSTD